MINFIKGKIKGIVRLYLKKIDSSVTREFHPYYDLVETQEKKYFDELYNKSILLTGTPPSVWRRDRFLNLFFLTQSIVDSHGDIIECGSWKGLSSLIINGAIKQKNEYYNGENYSIVDSFEGLSEVTQNDTPLKFDSRGKFAFSLPELRKNLSEFPRVTYYKGWIPEVFNSLPENIYKFVHIDVDLSVPTLESFKYFYPRMADGGIIVCDDYGSVTWLGMQNQIRIFCNENNISPIILSTGQLVVIKNTH